MIRGRGSIVFTEQREENGSGLMLIEKRVVGVDIFQEK
jgi:hypothetical protein